MDQHIFRRAREVAEASGLLEKSASIAAGRGLTGAAAVKYAASSFMDGVERLAVEMDMTAEANAERVVQKLEAAAPTTEEVREVFRSLKASGLSLEDHLDEILAHRDEKNAEATADLILRAGRHD